MSPLSNENNKTVDLYTKTSLIYGIKRGALYLSECSDGSAKEKNELTLRIKSVSIATIATSTLVGGIVGGTLGGVVGFANGGAPAAAGAIVGAAVGSGIGLSIGIVLAPIVTSVSIGNSDHFINWKTKALTEKVYPLFQEFLKQDAEFQDLLCPISHALPIVPVRSPNGHVYEKAEIEKWLDTNPANPCPMRGNKFTKADLTYSQEHVRKIVLRAKYLMRQQLIQDPMVAAGVEAAAKDLVNNNRAIHVAEITQIVNDAHANNLSPDHFAALAKKIYEQRMIPEAN